jgi:hypothetical protein
MLLAAGQVVRGHVHDLALPPKQVAALSMDEEWLPKQLPVLEAVEPPAQAGLPGLWRLRVQQHHALHDVGLSGQLARQPEVRLHWRRGHALHRRKPRSLSDPIPAATPPQQHPVLPRRQRVTFPKAILAGQ